MQPEAALLMALLPGFKNDRISLIVPHAEKLAGDSETDARDKPTVAESARVIRREAGVK